MGSEEDKRLPCWGICLQGMRWRIFRNQANNVVGGLIATSPAQRLPDLQLTRGFHVEFNQFVQPPALKPNYAEWKIPLYRRPLVSIY